jgi:hypothetical protein
MNQCSLESATHKVSDNHLHHGWQWLAAITPTDSSTPSTMGVDTYGNDLLKTLRRQMYKNLHPEFLLDLLKQQEESVVMLAST